MAKEPEVQGLRLHLPVTYTESQASSSSSYAVYQPTNILLTGGLGFIGSHVVLELVRQYSSAASTVNIIVLDKLDVCASPHNLPKDIENVKVVIGDICSQDLVNFVLREYEIDTIMHFAAQTHVDNSFGNSLTFTQNNVMGTHVLLEAARHAGLNGYPIRRFIHVSTDEVYGETSERMKENMVLMPTNPYAATKAAAELLVQSYHRSFGIPIIITRGNNVYGPHQYPEKLIPKFINLLLRDRPCCIHGDGSNTRSFLYVTDVARAFVLLLQRGMVGEIYNIGTEFEISNLEVAQHLIWLMDKGEDTSPSPGEQPIGDEEGKLIEFVEDRKFNDQRYHIDISKLAELGWKPEVDWKTGLKMTIEWYRSHQDHWPTVDRVLTAHPR